MPEQLGFETMLIIDPWGMAFHAVGVIGLTFDFLFKMVSSYCDFTMNLTLKTVIVQFFA